MAVAAPGKIATSAPVRAFDYFLRTWRYTAPLQTEGFDGVLEPLKPLSDKLLIMQNVDQVRCDESGINAHFDGASGAFTAEPPSGEAKAGGPSIDQVIRKAHYPKGLPSRAWFRPWSVEPSSAEVESAVTFTVTIKDGTVAGIMGTPTDLFERVFRSSFNRRRHRRSATQRLKRSALDSSRRSVQILHRC